MIRVSGLTKTYGAFTAVGNLSFEIRDGETFALLGPNGSGKTTTLKCLVGLISPDSGDIFINGVDARKLPVQARQMVSYLPQRVSFQENLTAREALAFYCKLRRLPSRRIDEVLGGTRFDFNGFGDMPIRTLSGGMLQRLGLAVACLPDAPILILDEPMINLDPSGAIRFREFLAAVRGEGKTILFSSHVLTDVEQLADRVGILVGGKLVALESVAALREGVLLNSKMRLTVANPSPSWSEVALKYGAKEVTADGTSLVITCLPEIRLRVLRAIEAEGGVIIRFATQEPSLEEIYLSYFHEEDPDCRGLADGGVPFVRS